MLHEVHSITRPVVDSKFANCIADRPDISKVPERKAANADLNSRPGIFVP